MLRLLDDPISGNGYKVRLLLAMLDTPYVYEALDILRSETRTDDFLKINPNGRIPVLVLEDGTALPESNAILNYLGRRDGLLASRPLAACTGSTMDVL